MTPTTLNAMKVMESFTNQARSRTSRDNVMDVLTALQAISEQDRADAERLDFVIRSTAFEIMKRTDAGQMTYQLWTQDENEDYVCLHDEKAFFSNIRLAIDAAIDAARQQEGKS